MIINHNNSHPWLLAVEDGGGLVLGQRGYEPDSVGPEGGGGGQELQVIESNGGDQQQQGEQQQAKETRFRGSVPRTRVVMITKIMVVICSNRDDANTANNDDALGIDD